MICSFTNPASRRIVLLGADDHGEPECVLAEPEAGQLHAEVVRQVAMFPGRRIAAEHWGPLGWCRWICAGERTTT